MYVCMYVCTHVCMYVCVHICMYARVYVCMYMLRYVMYVYIQKNVMKNNSNNKHEIELLFIFISCPLALPVYAHLGFNTQLLTHINQHDHHHTFMTKQKTLNFLSPSPPNKIIMPLGAP